MRVTTLLAKVGWLSLGACLGLTMLFGGGAFLQAQNIINPGFGWTCTGASCTFTVPLLLPNGSASAPAIAFAGNPTTGFYTGGSGEIQVSILGGTKFTFFSTGFYPATTDNVSLGLSGNAFSMAYIARSTQGSKAKTLTDGAAAVSFARIAVTTNGYIGGDVIYTANSTDGTNRLTTTGRYNFAGADTTGTVTCGTPNAVGTPATAYKRANILVCTVSAVTSTTNCDLQVTCTDNLAGDQAPTFEWRLDMPKIATVTPQ